jgi:imidazolonepropionase-like amidohydrolase
MQTMLRSLCVAILLSLGSASAVWAQAPGAERGIAVASPPSSHVVVLRAAHLLDVESGSLITPGEVLVRADQIAEAGTSVPHPTGAKVLDLGDATLMPGLIDAHVHLFLHPGAEDLQTVMESVPERTILAALAARDDLMAGFTAERDMGTEGAGASSTAIRNAIDEGLIPGPRMRMSANAISIVGGHEDAIGFNPGEHISSNADYANDSEDLVAVIREQLKEGADFIKIYETGADRLVDGNLSTPYQYTEAQLETAVHEAARMGTRVGVHCMGEPGALYAAEAGVASIDHAYQLSPETMRMMREKQIYAVPTFTVGEYFAAHAGSPAAAARERALNDFHIAEFRKQLAAGVPMAVGSDVGPFPHGTQARELALMEQHGMSAANVLRADLLNGARLLGWEGKIGELKSGYYADVIAVPGNPLQDMTVLARTRFVMKGGLIYRDDADRSQEEEKTP